MNITLSLDDDLVKQVRKIAIDRNTTLTGIIRDHLHHIVEEDEATGARRRQVEEFLRTVEELSFPMGERDWTREDLYVRGSAAAARR